MSTFFIRLLLLSLLLDGCEETFPVYQSYCQKSKTDFPSCLHYMVEAPVEKERIEKAFGLPNDPSCPYTVSLTKYCVGKCTNPYVKSVGGDFNGYVRIEVKKGFKCYYKIQSDYKNSMKAAFERVLKAVEKEHKSPENAKKI
ncbi:hypothetical protein [Sulfurovum riftiae]|uniref:Uncharacterized protein n=1 Tax=Sulfurovum riftiae TaxID=1630136 RepID=A0A151CI10_9BACT|nr:hypothetical protein [Sulfurovum riftiae]KYJ87151.1 hypothetical protein AS592_09125 [Sulfurovum riftiae]